MIITLPLCSITSNYTKPIPSNYPIPIPSILIPSRTNPSISPPISLEIYISNNYLKANIDSSKILLAPIPTDSNNCVQNRICILLWSKLDPIKYVLSVKNVWFIVNGRQIPKVKNIKEEMNWSNVRNGRKLNWFKYPPLLQLENTEYIWVFNLEK